MRRGYVHVRVDEVQLELIDQPVLRGKNETTFGILLCHLHLVLNFDGKDSAFLGEQLLRWPGIYRRLHEQASSLERQSA